MINYCEIRGVASQYPTSVLYGEYMAGATSKDSLVTMLSPDQLEHHVCTGDN